MCYGRENYWSRFVEDFENKNYYVAGIDAVEIIKKKLNQCGNLGNIIEFACGNGMFTQTLSLNAEHVLATDLSDEMIEATKRRLSNTSNVTIEKANCLSSPYGSESFDTVVMINLIHIISSPSKVLSESHRLLKPAGRLIVASFTMEKMKLFRKMAMAYRYLKTYGSPPKDSKCFTIAELKGLVENQGFSIKEASLIDNSFKRRSSNVFFINAEKTTAR
jgi:ubiquinone/menaquinone biosynthesis C-methylase UbiE